MIDILDGGLPEHWQITKEYNETIYYVTKQINNRFPRDKNLLISTQWEWMIPPNKSLNSPKFEPHYDNVFILSTLEPVPKDRIPEYESKGDNIYYIGNTVGKGYFSFWSIQTKNFKKYTDEEIKPESFRNKFLCYNRNPHEHRLKLSNEIIKRNLQTQGTLTLGDHFYTHNVSGKYPHALSNAPMVVDNGTDELIDLGEAEAIKEAKIPHDTYTLGNIDIWKNTFLVVVTETTTESNIFMSEKIFKPMIGKRPFIVLGDTGITNHLLSCGFKVFNKYFDINFDRLPPYSSEKYRLICDVIENVSNKSETELQDLYQTMLPDIEHNYENVSWFREHNQLKIQNQGLFRL